MLIKLSKIVNGVPKVMNISKVTTKKYLVKHAEKIFGVYYIDEDSAKEVLRKEFKLTDEQIKEVLKN